MASSLRRLAADHASLHNSGLPPNYFFPPSSSSAFPDDLTQLTILLTGPQWTPYSQGLWKLHLRMPDDYPQSPPKASFRTRIWHPNVEESTGGVCVDTLKRDWESSLTLRDVLITISCLLIQPNPDSALNSAAGSLLQDDYEVFARQTRLMTSIHAPIPSEMKDAVMEAKRRGEDPNTAAKREEQEKDDKTRSSSAKRSATSSVIIKKKTHPSTIANQDTSNGIEKLDIRTKSPPHGDLQKQPQHIDSNVGEEEYDPEENPATASKENDPSLSISPVVHLPQNLNPRRNNNSVLGKRPLSVLSVPSEPELVLVDGDDDEDGFDDGLGASERNIVANLPRQHEKPKQTPDGDMKDTAVVQQPQLHKSPKLSDLTRSANSNLTSRTKGLDKTLNGEIPTSIETAATDERVTSMNENNKKNNSNDNAATSTMLPDDCYSSTAAPTSSYGLAASNNNNTPVAVSNVAPPPSSLSSGTTTTAGPAIKKGAPFSKQQTKPRLGLRRL